mmetsp:Transcript_50978/g.110600  ORF Transcript_50978/g.110600 Transcript_50978/m.110600 type:complete len:348 (-) Transcript_50978:163-1206(-)
MRMVNVAFQDDGDTFVLEESAVDSAIPISRPFVSARETTLPELFKVTVSSGGAREPRSPRRATSVLLALLSSMLANGVPPPSQPPLVARRNTTCRSSEADVGNRALLVSKNATGVPSVVSNIIPGSLRSDTNARSTICMLRVSLTSITKFCAVGSSSTGIPSGIPAALFTTSVGQSRSRSSMPCSESATEEAAPPIQIGDCGSSESDATGVARTSAVSTDTSEGARSRSGFINEAEDGLRACLEKIAGRPEGVRLSGGDCHGTPAGESRGAGRCSIADLSTPPEPFRLMKGSDPDFFSELLAVNVSATTAEISGTVRMNTASTIHRVTSADPEPSLVVPLNRNNLRK